MTARTHRAGFTAVPHGVWTVAGLSVHSRMLLCWLHSHNDEYREALGVASISRLLGWDRKTVTRSLAELEALGLVVVEVPVRGLPARVLLDVDAWIGLHGERLRAVRMPK